MHRFTLARVATLAAGVAFAVAAQAGNITLYPTSPGVVSAAGASGGAPGFGTSSFKENGSTKGELYITPAALFGHAVTFNDIASVSYWTNKPGGAGDVDWSFYLYTSKTGTGDTGSFYHSRLTTEPYFTNSGSDAPNTWHQWTSGGAEPMRFYDQARSGAAGTYTDPSLATLQMGSYTWAMTGTSNDYRPEDILYFSLQTGSAWAAGFLGVVDGLVITLKTGEVGSVNLEAAPGAVPEPASVALVATGLVALGLARRRRRA